jgi:hypothetical protein
MLHSRSASGRSARRTMSAESRLAGSACALVAVLLALLLFPTGSRGAGTPAPPAAVAKPAAAPAAAPQAEVARAVLSAPKVPATGVRTAIVAVERFGRYSLRAESKQGTALAVVDRMAGELGRAGRAGSENGRLDLFLDRGEYKLIAASHPKGTGEARLDVQPFREIHPAPAVELVETKLVAEKLDDLEQASYWLHLTARREVRLEAAGRNLGDLRVWRDGSWLEGVEPDCATVQPVTGQPLWRCRIAALLPAGLYRVTAYGGAPQPWAEGSDEHPLYLRWGAPALPEAGRRRFQISPFGEDSFQVPSAVNFFRLELPEARPARLRLDWVKPGEPFPATSDTMGEITKKSVPPAVELTLSGEAAEGSQPQEQPAAEPAQEAPPQGGEGMQEGGGEGENQGGERAEPAPPQEEAPPAAGAETPAAATESEAPPAEPESAEPEPPATAEPAAGPDAAEKPVLWVTVSGTPGQPYVLQQFEARQVYTFRKGGSYWISTVHSGHAEDAVDATALLTVEEPRKKPRLLTAAAIPLAAQQPWARRFNLLEPSTLFLEVKERGRYKVLAKGVPVRVRCEPFLISKPEHYKAPDFRRAGSEWDLDAGYYVLTVAPEKQGPRGILELGLRVAGQAGAALDPLQPQPVRAAARLGALDLDAADGYTLYLNDQPGVRSGAVLRPLPLDLTEALPVAQRPGETLSFPFAAAASGTLRAEAEDGTLLELAVDGGAAQTAAAVAPGRHEVAVRNAGPRTVVYSLALAPAALEATAPLPPLPAAALAALPRFPVLAAGAPRFLDLGRGESTTFVLQADRPALYRVGSSGLLATAGILRTRTVPKLAAAESNGVGRNFVLQQYLREGDYQITVAASGRSRGHLGVALESTPLVDGGELRAGLPARASLPAGQALVYRFTVAEAGDYRLRALGLGFKFHGRLEDADGWPIEAPGLVLDRGRRFEPGTYRVVLLPQPVATRALTLLERQEEPPHFAGHGPHEVPLAALERGVESVWREPAEGQERQADLWRFELPAHVHATVALDAEMEGTLAREGTTGAIGANTEVGKVPPGRSWSGELEAGRYVLAAVCSRRNNLVRYHLSVRPEELVAGLARDVRPNGTVPLAVGREGLFELSSFGATDVRARLYDAAGLAVADADDRPDDWNFLLFQRLAPGAYGLRVEAVGGKAETVRVAMRQAEEVEGRPLALPYHGAVELRDAVQLYPLPDPGDADLLLLAAHAKESLGLSLERRQGDGWRTLGTAVARDAHLEVPLPGAGPYRLRLWSLDRRGTPVRLSAVAASAPRLGEGDLRRGVALRPVAGFEPPLAAAVVALDRPGVFRLQEPDPTLRASGVAGEPLAATSDAGLLAAPGERLWLVQELPARGAHRGPRAERATLAAGQTLQFQLPAAVASLDLAPAPQSGPLLVQATALAGQPGLRLAEEEDADLAPSAAGMAAGPHAAVAVALAPRRPVARVWEAGPAGAEQPPEVKLTPLAFPPPTVQTAAWGTLQGTLAGVSAIRFELPAGPKRLRLSLGESTVAVLADGFQALSTHWQGGAPFEELLDARATGLLLFHTRDGSDPFAVSLLPATDELGLAAPFERTLDRAGTLRLTLSPESTTAAGAVERRRRSGARPPDPASGGSAESAPAPSLPAAVGTPQGRDSEAPEGDRPRRATVHVRGADVEATLLDAAGGVARGTDLAVGDRGGVLLIRHAPGLVLAWVDTDPAGSSSALWPAASLGAPVQVTLPAAVPLAGPFAHLAFTVREPTVLHLRTPSPVITLLQRGDGSSEVEVHRDSGRLDVFLAPGEVHLGLRAFAGAALAGPAELTTSAVAPIGEGLGPEVLLPAGGTRYFSFHLGHPGPVGIGVRADSDVVVCELFDRSGRRLGGETAGVVQMPELQPGDYLLALRSPAAAAPVKARPALAGLDLPDTGPPEEVVRKYLQEAGVAVPAAGSSE